MRLAGAVTFALVVTTICKAEQQFIVISKDGRGFSSVESGERFIPWGFNYPAGSKLLEDIWDSDWSTLAEDFREMRGMGANVVRVHLQVAQFMEAADRPNAKSLERLAKLVRLAEETGLYLDVTGLGCYRPADGPAWYDGLSREERWAVQGRFWAAVAEVCAKSPAVFCYDLMNEPVVPGEARKSGAWRSGKLLGGLDFVQCISLDAPDRPRDEIAAEWMRTLTTAIRQKDEKHLITVGMLPSVKKWGHLSGFVPEKNAPDLDFISVHIYPASGNLEEAREVLEKFSVGRPVVIEETFNLSCSAPELREFLLESRGKAVGWIGHYSGESLADLDELQKSGKLTIAQAITQQWLELFRSLGAEMTEGTAAGVK
jgi:hypothetical protein